MKKFLSLVLALVMTMSLVTISAGAKDFTDDSKINYEEAVDVMSALKVIDGYPDGSFAPQGSLTRGAAAKIICNLILGPTTASALSADTAPYKDVPVNHTFAGYIAYCQEQGIISGYADGSFRPGATLTNYAFLKMLLGALGYNAEIEGYVGDNWSIAVAKQALHVGLTKGLDGDLNGTDYATREQACLYALNTLKATMVDYEAKITANVNGAQVIVGNSVANDVKWNIASNSDGHIKDDGYVQFAEKYFEKLELETGNGMYGRPTNVWKLKKSEIGAYTSIEPTYVYTEDMDQDEAYKDLGKTICDEDEYDWTAFVNGEEQKSVDVPAKVEEYWKYTGKGTVTEIYVDDDAETVTVCEINHYLGQVSKVKTDDDGEYISVKVLSDGAKDLDNKTFYVEGYEEDDYVVFTMDWDEDEKESVIGEVFEPETVTGVVTRVDYDKKESGITDSEETKTYLKMDGEKYTYTDAGKADHHKHMVYDVEELDGKHPELDDEYMLYMDPNGYVLGFKVTEESVDQYLWVKDSDEELKDWVAKVVLPDATTPKVDVDKDLEKTPDEEITVPSNDKKITFTGDDEIDWIETDDKYSKDDYTNIDGLIWKYSVNKKNVYELTYVKVFDSVEGNIVDSGKKDDGITQWYLEDAEIESGEAYVTYNVTEDSKTVNKNGFIVDKQTIFVDTVNDKVYTGYKEVPNVENAELAYVLDGKVAKVVFILDGDIYDEGNIYFIIADNGKRESFKYDDKNFWTYEKAYVNGEKTELNVKYGADKANDKDVLSEGVLYEVKKTIDEDYITEVEKIADPDTDNVWAVGDDAFWLKGTGVTPEKWTCDDETVFVVVDTDKDGDLKVFNGDLKDLVVSDDLAPADEDGDYEACSAVVLKKDDNYAKLVYVWRTEVGADTVKEDDGKYVVNFWQASDSGNVCFAFYKEDGTALTAREVKNLGLTAEDFSIVIDGEKYKGLTVEEYGTNENDCGFMKVNFGEQGTVLIKGDKFITDGDDNNIDFDFSIKGVDIDEEASNGNINVTESKKDKA